ncbi:MAG: DUF91 domain-containing protein [Selenomonas ruminantium]|jgi:predicted transport protein|uniref:DUF91 domain-containing protein n=1 Tax=Selenomonas ruminantium TaxID=971 RepID=A0A927WKH4_SELRU|nr:MULTISPECIES: endonuclease NucS domain-containing protein [Selenomonas]MBE6084847.1 DUF91 domain-containing protein [Selenomonas ruminantium]
MSDIKLFETVGSVKELLSSKVHLEKELQNLIEDNMELFFGVRFLKSEYAITNGRMDSIGIDENNSPVIFEYKRSSNENVINQGLFYLDWLLDHKGDFQMLVIEKMGMDVANAIDWSVPSVICIASDFTKYDIHAVNQMQRNIKLVKYRKYSNGQILFEHLNTPIVKQVEQDTVLGAEKKGSKTHQEKLKEAPQNIRNIYYELCNYIESLGDDISANQLKLYLAYKTTQNLACIEIYKKHVTVYLKLSPDLVDLEAGFSKDMRGIGHYGTGDLQLTLKTVEDLNKAKALIDRAYNEA